MNEIVDRHACDYRGSRNWTLLQQQNSRAHQDGTIAVMFAGALVVILGFFGMAFELSRIYNRKAELQGVADAVAISAAKQLNGTATGIDNALAAAKDVLETSSFRPRYAYSKTMSWDNAAIMFGTAANGGESGWVSSGTASTSPAGLAFVKVDTSALKEAYGTVDLLFMKFLSSSASVLVKDTAVAGKSGLQVTPLGICAMSETPADLRANASATYDELREYGFRRGISYDLMQLNPNGTTAANFLIDPISLAGGGATPDYSVATVGPYVCAGVMAVPKITNATVSVKSGFPIGSLVDHLNSRFDQSNGQCNPKAAPPDSNVMEYQISASSSIGWMGTPKPIFQTAETSTAGGKLQTIADVASSSQTATHYGPLWAYAKAVPWSSYSSGQPEPAAGYATFPADKTTWAGLYPSGPAFASYPARPPYFDSGYSTGPSVANGPGVLNRRVLNVPLLSCPVSGSTAKVLAIGKFFMTMKASTTSIRAEFAGIATDLKVSGRVDLYKPDGAL